MDFLLAAWGIPKGKIRKFSLLLIIPIAVSTFFLGIDPFLCAALAVATVWTLPHIFKGCVKRCLMPTMTKNRSAASPHLRQALDFYLKEDYDRAIVEYGMAISIDRYSASKYNLRASLFSLQKKYDYAIVDYTSTINIAPKLIGLGSPVSDNLMNELALAFNGRGRAYFAIEEFDIAIDDFTNAIDCLSVLGMVKAFQDLELDDDVSLDLYRAFDYRGRASLAKGNYDLAVIDLKSSQRLDPHSIDDRIVRWADEDRIVRRADDHCKCGAYELAITGYTLAIDIDPYYANHYNKRGLAYLAKDEYDLAIADFDAAISMSSNFDEMIYKNRDKALRAKEQSDSEHDLGAGTP